ncbi:GtrA family protein [Chloroflexota bacterium]
MTIPNNSIRGRFKQLIISARNFVNRSLDKYRWIRFAIVGGTGSLVHFAVLFSLTEIAGLWYMLSAVIAVLAAATNNYILNNIWTFKGKRVHSHIIGWLKYILLASVSDAIYLLLLAFFTEVAGLWYMLSALISLLIVFPFRYNISRLWIWGDLGLSRIISNKHPDEADYDWHAFANGSPIQKWWKLSIARAIWSLVPEESYVLDIGCGSSPILSKYKGVGIDSNRDKIEFMKSHLGDTGQCKYLVGNALSLPFENNSFDAVLCIEVIEHLKNPDSVIAEIMRVTKPNAKIVLATPDYSKPLAYIIDIMTPYGGYHTYRFTRRSLEKLCRAHGLKPLKYKYVGSCDLVELFEKMNDPAEST